MPLLLLRLVIILLWYYGSNGRFVVVVGVTSFSVLFSHGRSVDDGAAEKCQIIIKG